MKRRRGLSLIEFLIVIAVVGVLVALVSVGARGLLDRGRLNESLNAVEAQVGQARRLAKRLDRQVTFQILATSGVWRTAVDGAESDLPGRAVVPSGGTSITFDPPFGTYDGSDVEMVLDVNGVTASVVVTGVLARTVVLR